MSTPLLTYELAKRQIMRRHLEQLQDLDLTEKPFLGKPATNVEELVKWTEDSQTQINTAIKNGELSSLKGCDRLS